MNANRTQRRTGWFLVWVGVVMVMLAMAPGNDLAYPAAAVGGLFVAIGYVHLRGTRKR